MICGRDCRVLIVHFLREIKRASPLLLCAARIIAGGCSDSGIT